MVFKDFKVVVAKQFEQMKQHGLFRVQVEKDLLWETYLNSFPEGTNPMLRQRTEYDCQACRSFIKAVGGIVAIVDGKVVSIWDVTVKGYQPVADALSALVKSRPIENIFLHTDRTAGVDKNFQQIINEVITWQHFFINIPNEYVVRGADIGTRLSDSRTIHDVFLRSLKEINNESIDTVLDLIAQNSLYRGEENKFAVVTFQNLKKKFDKLTSEKKKDIFVWSQFKALPQSVSKIRNTAIGTLLMDLSEGRDIESAVGSFEFKVAGPNYKRPTSLITKAMIDMLQEKIEEMGLTSATMRRYARLTDITVNNVLFANRTARKSMSGNIFDELSSQVPEKIKKFDKVEEVPIEKFISDILPRVDTIELMLENRHIGNLVSLIAPSDPTSGYLFKWPNRFSWSYNGEVADSTKERVKNAGGNVLGDLCCRLVWFNYDDLDLHMKEPSRYELYYVNKSQMSPSGGRLDVDMNAGRGVTREPAENIFYLDKRTMKEGRYILQVHNYNKRETIDTGFEVEIDFLGTVYHFVYGKPVKDQETITVVEFDYSHKNGIVFVKSLPSTQTVKNIWGLPTQAFHNVNVMTLSPNYWDEKAVGNKHYFFMLDGCLNDGKARGFFNEFLRPEFETNRKVFEVMGSRLKVEESSDQLSGLGFSSTQHTDVLCKVKGRFSRIIKITF